jgi:hypothetical protein
MGRPLKLPPPSLLRPAISKARIHGMPGQMSMYVGQCAYYLEDLSVYPHRQVLLTKCSAVPVEIQTPHQQHIYSPHTIKRYVSNIFHLHSVNAVLRRKLKCFVRNIFHLHSVNAVLRRKLKCFVLFQKSFIFLNDACAQALQQRSSQT